MELFFVLGGAFFFATITALLAPNRGFHPGAGFALGFLFGPIPFFVLLVMSPKKVAAPKIQEAIVLDNEGRVSLANETKTCPLCAETIKFESKKCRFCGEAFDLKEIDGLIAARRAEIEELRDGKKVCPRCRSLDVRPHAMLPNGGFGPWCPHCQKAVP